MSILINESSRVLVQGITGSQGVVAVKDMLDYGTKVVAGVTPGKAGQFVEGVPVFNCVVDALAKHNVTHSLVIVPPKFAKDAVLEAISAGIKIVVVVTETIPVHDTAVMIREARNAGVTLIGPSSIGIISPGKAKIGLISQGMSKSFVSGRVGIISKSGGMCSETALVVRNAGFGQSCVVGIGGDVLAGSDFVDILKLFNSDPDTDVVILYGEIGGCYEELAANYIKNHFSKPVIAFVAGLLADSLPDVSLGHAGAIVENGAGSRENKVKVLKDAGVHVVDVHHFIGDKLKELLK